MKYISQLLLNNFFFSSFLCSQYFIACLLDFCVTNVSLIYLCSFFSLLFSSALFFLFLVLFFVAGTIAKFFHSLFSLKTPIFSLPLPSHGVPSLSHIVFYSFLLLPILHHPSSPFPLLCSPFLAAFCSFPAAGTLLPRAPHSRTLFRFLTLSQSPSAIIHHALPSTLHPPSFSSRWPAITAFCVLL